MYIFTCIYIYCIPSQSIDLLSAYRKDNKQYLGTLYFDHADPLGVLIREVIYIHVNAMWTPICIHSHDIHRVGKLN